MEIQVIFHSPEESKPVTLNYITENGDEIPAFYTSEGPFMYAFRRNRCVISKKQMEKIAESINENKKIQRDEIAQYISNIIKEYKNTEIENQILNGIIRKIEKETENKITTKTQDTKLDEIEEKYDGFNEKKFEKLAVYSSETENRRTASTWGVDKDGNDHLIASTGTDERIIYTSPNLNKEDRIEPKDTFYYNIDVGFRHWLTTKFPHDMFVFMDTDNMTEEGKIALYSIVDSIIMTHDNVENDEEKVRIRKETIKKIINSCQDESLKKRIREKI